MLADVARRRLRLASGIEIALLDWGGDGPLALLHHANGFCAGLWGLVAERLRPHFRLFAMDARGHGASSKPDPAEPEHYAWSRFGEDAGAVARQLAAEQGGGALLGIGHSFGGTALMMAAADDPALFERLVLVDPVLPSPELFASAQPEAAGGPRNLAISARRRRQVFASRAEARAAWAGRAVFADWDPRALDLYAEFGLVARAQGGVELACPGEIEATIFDQARRFDAFALAARVSRPALILCALRGNFGRAAYDAVAARMPDARVVDVPAGHLVPMERPDLVAEQVLAFGGRASHAAPDAARAAAAPRAAKARSSERA
jgi:pimeloyl-ACP methyl ester carboxylesterase